MSQSVGVAIERKRHSIKKPASRRNASKLPVQSTGGLSSRQSGGARGERSTLASSAEDFLQCRDQRRALLAGTHRNPQELLDARQPEMAHDDAALP